jgi:hypothetical protein
MLVISKLWIQTCVYLLHSIALSVKYIRRLYVGLEHMIDVRRWAGHSCTTMLKRIP